MQHCNDYDLLPDYQSAYPKGYSCETCNLKLANDILCNMEVQQVTPTILLDLSAAFDTVDHDLLLQILEKDFGIKGTAFDWYKQYLYPRDFRVCVGASYSEPKDIHFSVPQGSASGANIFSAYCSSLHRVLEKSIDIQGFADDHSIRSSFKGGNYQQENTCIRNLQDSFDNIIAWMNQMKLKLNPSKTEFIIFGGPVQLAKVHTTHFMAGDSKIPRSESVKILGSFFDQSLNFKNHCEKQAKKALMNYLNIRNVRKYLDRSTCETLVLALVMSHLDYCNAILYGVLEITLQKLQHVQNMCRLNWCLDVSTFQATPKT